MLARVMGTSYETLMKRYIFRPLGVSSAGDGQPYTMMGFGRNIPWPHRFIKDESTNWKEIVELRQPQSNGMPDNIPIITPAARWHMTMQDWSRIVAALISFKVASTKLGMTRDAYDAIATVNKNGYGLGVYVNDGGLSGSKSLSHSGSNMSNYCEFEGIRGYGVAVMVATNTQLLINGNNKLTDLKTKLLNKVKDQLKSDGITSIEMTEDSCACI